MNLWASSSKYFSKGELSCRCGCGTAYVSKQALDKLDRLRERLDAPLYLSSAARCPRHNALIGGKPLSFHRSTFWRPSCAFDIRMVGVEQDMVMKYAEIVGFRGIGSKSYRSFVHVDDRSGGKARW